MKSLESLASHQTDQKQQAHAPTLPSLHIRKVEKANMFLVNPKDVSPDDDEESQLTHSESSEPWLELVGNSETVRHQRQIEAQMHHILAKQGKQKSLITSRLSEEAGFDTRKLMRKMKKYQPANSSFSLFYGQKQEVEELEAMPHRQLTIQQRRKLLRLPALNRSLSKNGRSNSLHSSSFLKHDKLDISPKGQRKMSKDVLGFIGKIKDIYHEGNMVSARSSKMIGRIDRATDYLGQKYAEFTRASEDMISDIGNYRLEEEETGEYKKDFADSFCQEKEMSIQKHDSGLVFFG